MGEGDAGADPSGELLLSGDVHHCLGLSLVELKTPARVGKVEDNGGRAAVGARVEDVVNGDAGDGLSREKLDADGRAGGNGVIRFQQDDKTTARP